MAQVRPLRVSVSFDKATYVPGEPVIAHVAIENPAGNPSVAIPEQLDPEYMRLNFLVKHGDEPEAEFHPWALLENDRTVALAPGNTKDVHARIFFVAAGWTFARTGAYTVRAALGRSTPEPTALAVEMPADGEDRTQSNQIADVREAGLCPAVDRGGQ